MKRAGPLLEHDDDVKPHTQPRRTPTDFLTPSKRPSVYGSDTHTHTQKQKNHPLQRLFLTPFSENGALRRHQPSQPAFLDSRSASSSSFVLHNVSSFTGSHHASELLAHKLPHNVVPCTLQLHTLHANVSTCHDVANCLNSRPGTEAKSHSWIKKERMGRRGGKC